MHEQFQKNKYINENYYFCQEREMSVFRILIINVYVQHHHMQSNGVFHSSFVQSLLLDGKYVPWRI